MGKVDNSMVGSSFTIILANFTNQLFLSRHHHINICSSFSPLFWRKRDQHQQIELYCMSQEWKLPKAAAGCFHRPGGQRKKGKINIFNLNLNLNFNCDEIEQMKLSSLRSYCFMHTTFIVGAFLFSLNPIIPKLQWTLMC